MAAYLRQLFPSKGYALFIGLCFPQAWMFVISSAIVCDSMAFQLAFHAGIITCLAVLAFTFRSWHASHRPWHIVVDIFAALAMIATAFIGIFNFELSELMQIMLGVVAGAGLGISFSRWFCIYCHLHIREAFSYSLLGFSVGAIGCLIFIGLLFISSTAMLIFACILPVLSVLASRHCDNLIAQDDPNDDKTTAVIQQKGSKGQIIFLCVQIGVYALIFGNGIIFSILQSSIPSSPDMNTISLINYSLRAILPIILFIWLAVRTVQSSRFYRSLVNAIMLLAVFVLLGIWFIGGMGSVVSLAVISLARNLVIMLIFLACLRLTVVSNRSPMLVYAGGRGMYEIATIAGTIVYAWLTNTYGTLSMEQSLVFITAACAFIFLAGCFFATAQGLDSNDEVADDTVNEVSPDEISATAAKSNKDLHVRFNLTEREYEVLMLFYRGYSKRRIAETLGLSENTVRWYLQQLYGRLDVHNRDELLELIDGPQYADSVISPHHA